MHSTTLPPAPPEPAGTAFSPANRWVSFGGRDYVAIERLERFEPFFLNLAGIGNQWLFCSSHGSLSAGRESAETALFPYYTDDKITDNWNTTGPWTGIVSDGKLWIPFRPSVARLTPVHRRLMKSPLGDELVFDEHHGDLRLRMSYRWRFSQAFGFVRTARLANEATKTAALRLVDGLDNFMPAGVDSRFQLQYSCLADAYKVSETLLGGSLVVHRLAAGITDQPVPLESLRATTVWAAGAGDGPTYLDRRDAEAFLRGSPPTAPTVVRGRRGAMFLARELVLEPGEAIEWIQVADIGKTQSEVASLCRRLARPEALLAEVEADIVAGSRRLAEIVADADGFQETADRDVSLHHYHNTLCNILRGGVPGDGYRLSLESFLRHLAVHNRPLAERFSADLRKLPETLHRNGLLERVRELGDPDLDRIATEYLPLILSRRHGDPSRPWNRFFIRVSDADGNPVHHFEGNWRDIFQNWEALAWSYPEYLESFVAKFLNASTIDGFNPYRITSEGIDWEVPDPEDPWSSIGYWGDHQIVYLLKLLELESRVHPERLASRMDSPDFVFADVPYRLASWEETLADPRGTVRFDAARHAALHRLKAEIGADGLLLRDREGEPVRATLLEKLLIPAVAKLANLVPGGGIWMNTQRPEWNDANNALAGCGLSVVTAGHLHRYLGRIARMLEDHPGESLRLGAALTGLVEALGGLFADTAWRNCRAMTPDRRFQLARTAGLAVERYRRLVHADGPGEARPAARGMLLGFLRDARGALAATLRANRRDDRLWHSYNVLHIDAAAGRFEVARLAPMLEGQVSILGSGILEPEEALELLEALPASPLRSERHGTYLLYPDADPPSFLDTNRVADDDARRVPLLAGMIDRGDTRLLVPDPAGGFRFQADLVNAYALAGVLDALALESPWAERARTGRGAVEALYESTFSHRSFTGRSSSMFGYEGLGCVYWHMVSKLMLAAQEVVLGAVARGAADGIVRRLTACYFEIQGGLGFRQPAEKYGAFPAEPYSHSPGHAGARQPGLTGQVKEGILCRLGELGVGFHDGRLRFHPRLLRRAEFGNDGRGAVRFSVAGTPVTYRLDDRLDRPLCRLRHRDGRESVAPGADLDPGWTRAVTGRGGEIESLEIEIPTAWTLV